MFYTHYCDCHTLYMHYNFLKEKTTQNKNRLFKFNDTCAMWSSSNITDIEACSHYYYYYINFFIIVQSDEDSFPICLILPLEFLHRLNRVVH